MTDEDRALRAARTWAAHAALATSASRFSSALAASGVPAIWVKGLALGASVYEGAEGRPMEDADVRIPWASFDRALEAARDAGFAIVETSRAYRSAVFTVDERMIDLEASIGPPGLCGMTVEKMLPRAELLTLVTPGGGANVLVPELHDHLVVLLVNAFKDKCELTPPWVAEDLRRLVRSPHFEAATLVARAREYGACAIVASVADWMTSRDAHEAWATLRARAGAHASRMYLRAYAAARSRPSSLGTRLVARLGSDRIAGKAQGAVRMLAYAAEKWLR